MFCLHKLHLPNVSRWVIFIKNQAILTHNTMLKELKGISVDKLVKSADLKKKILSFYGAFSDMSSKDYGDFLKETQKTRTELFNRDVQGK